MIQKKKEITTQRIKYVAMDFVMTSIAFAIFNILRFRWLYSDCNLQSMLSLLFTPKLIMEQIGIPILLSGVNWVSGYYNRPLFKSRILELTITLLTSLFSTILIFFLLLINDTVEFGSTNYLLVLSIFTLLFSFTYAGRLYITTAAMNYQRRHPTPFNTLIIGTKKGYHSVIRTMESTRGSLQYRIVAHINLPNHNLTNKDNHSEGDSEFNRDSYIENLFSTCRERNIHQVIIAPGRHHDRIILETLYMLFPLDISVKIMPDTLSFLTSSIKLNDIFGEPFIDLTSSPLSNFEGNLKILIDKLVAIAMLIMLSPFYLIIAVAIKCTSKGPVFYSQTRIGYRRRPFKIYKFRTMVKDAEKDGPQLSSNHDPRITALGTHLRKYRLDEIPQFWNVLKGDMSIVGPRPERSHFINEIVKLAPYYRLVFQVKPGITSWGMVKYGYASCVEQMVERTKYDLLYINNMSIALDMKIVIYTFRTILKGSGM